MGKDDKKSPGLRRARVDVPRLVVGWREWIELPEFDIPSIKAKVDTGARTSSLHAFEIERVRRRSSDRVRFSIHPEQRSGKHAVLVEAGMDGPVGNLWIAFHRNATFIRMSAGRRRGRGAQVLAWAPVGCSSRAGACY